LKYILNYPDKNSTVKYIVELVYLSKIQT